MRTALLALAVLAGSTATLAMDAPAAEAAEGACADATGVTVVVDFQELGGGVSTRCAPGPVSDGFDALRRAGIDHQSTVRFSGFLCRIAGQPSSDPCIDTPPASAYWSYWIADRGGHWCYSNLGAGNRRPPGGTVEGWSFSLGRSASNAPAPRLRPPAALPGVGPRLPAGECDARPNPPAPTVPTPVAPNPPGPNAPAPSPATPVVPAAGDPDSSPGARGTEVPGPAPEERPSDPAADLSGLEDTRPDGASPTGDEPAEGGSMADVSTTTTLRATGEADTEVLDAAELAGTRELGTNRRDGAGPRGAVIAAALVVALALGAIFTARRRRVGSG